MDLLTSVIIPHPDREIVGEFARLCLPPSGAIIAGGAALQWFQQKSVAGSKRDVDVFFSSEEDFVFGMRNVTTYVADPKKLKSDSETITSMSIVVSTDNAITIKVVDSDKNTFCIVQLIKNNHFSKPIELISQFDLSISQIATDGFTWFTTESFMRDFGKNQVSVERVGINTAKRLLKYSIEYAYDTAPGSFSKVCDDPNTIWTMKEEYYHGI